MPLPDGLRRFNRLVTNRVLGPLSGRVPPFATVIHRGRSSGRTHRTIVLAFRHGAVVAIALTYGRDVDWLRNLEAAGGGAIELADGVWPLMGVRLAGEEGRRLMPWPYRIPLRLLRVTEYLIARRW